MGREGGIGRSDGMLQVNKSMTGACGCYHAPHFDEVCAVARPELHPVQLQGDEMHEEFGLERDEKFDGL